MIKNLQFTLIIFLFSNTVYGEYLKEGSRYKIIKPVYLIANYNSQSNKSINKETAKAYLESTMLAKRRFTAFQFEVPVETVMTIIGLAPKPWYLYFQGDMYFVELDPDLSQGLDVKIQLDRGMEGNLDGLNPEIFQRM